MGTKPVKQAKTTKAATPARAASKPAGTVMIPIATDVPKPPKVPTIIDLGPSQKVAVVTAVGDPNESLAGVLPALYGSVYTLKFSLKKSTPGRATFKVGALRGRWLDAHEKPKSQWTGLVALPVPEDTTALPVKDETVEIKLDTWTYGPCACILHVGPYTAEEPTIKRLHEFIIDQGHVFNGDHEEWYLTRPTAKVQKTLLLHPVRPAASPTELETFRAVMKAYWDSKS